MTASGSPREWREWREHLAARFGGPRHRAWAIAHRGDPLGHRENTLPAVRAALAAGADAIEVDVRTTRDGAAVLLHDETLSRLWRVRARVADLTIDELRRRAPGVPTLVEALHAVAGAVPLVLDVGSVASAHAALTAVDAVRGPDGAPPPVWFCGDPHTLVWLRQNAPDPPRLLSWDRRTAVPPDLVDAVAPVFVNLRHGLLSPTVVRHWHERGLLVSAWTVDRPRRRERLARWGVDAVISNDASARRPSATVAVMRWEWVAGILAGLVSAWAALLIMLLLVRPKGPLLREAVRLLPDLLRLLRRLAADPALPRGVRVRLGLLLAYLALPLDLVPDVIPVLGYADDAIVATLVLRQVVRRAGLDAVRSHWPGTPDGFEALRRLTGLPSTERHDHPPSRPGA